MAQPRKGNLKDRVWKALTPERHDHHPHFIGWFLLVLIAANVIAVMIETVPGVPAHHPFLHWFDVISIVIFSIEYLSRVWSSTSDEQFRRPILGRLRYMVTPLAIVDLVVIVPFYFAGVFTSDLRVLWLLRVVRIFRLLKMTRYLESLDIIAKAIRKRLEALMVGLFLCVAALVFSATAIFILEHDAQPEKFPSIPAALWWASVTITTTGYGDVIPVTPWGKVLGGVLSFAGIALFAIPVSILTSGFVEEYNARRGVLCPSCGHRTRKRRKRV